MFNFSFNVPALISTFPIVAQGMGGVFAVIIMVWIAIVLLTRFCK